MIEQHLAEFPGGRFQALPVGYDLEHAEWFDLFPGDPRAPEDWGHWSGRGMTANSECLFCHTTGFERGYELSSDSYQTSWAEIGVGCEACHGPGASHVAARKDRSNDAAPYGLLGSDRMLDACAACHALRRELWSGFAAGDPLLDYFEPVLLDESDYYADGQLLGEAYEWGSFVQSRMYREGVTCSDCHEPHGAELRATGNELCLTCHEPRFTEHEHTGHVTDSQGSQCLPCHMPEKVFMARDKRRDHSFSIPDPALTLATGAPNPCQTCHPEHDASWAVEHAQSWYGEGETSIKRRELAAAISQARAGRVGPEQTLASCLRSCDAPIWQATAAKLLAPYLGLPGIEQALIDAATSTNDLVRATAVWSLAEPEKPSPAALRTLETAASDPVRAVRLNAAWGLRAVVTTERSGVQQEAVDKAGHEWEASAMSQADYAESHHSLGLFYEAGGLNDRAIAAYDQALGLAPGSVPPRFNKAMLLVDRGDTEAAVAELERVIELEPEIPSAQFSLGLLYGELEEWRAAVAAFTECVKLDPYYPEALHNLAHAYLGLDEANLANEVLEAALTHPRARAEALRTLVTVNLEVQDTERARRWAKVAAEEIPGFGELEQVQALLRD